MIVVFKYKIVMSMLYLNLEWPNIDRILWEEFILIFLPNKKKLFSKSRNVVWLGKK